MVVSSPSLERECGDRSLAKVCPTAELELTMTHLEVILSTRSLARKQECLLIILKLDLLEKSYHRTKQRLNEVMN